MHIIAAKAAGFLEAVKPYFKDYIKKNVNNKKFIDTTYYPNGEMGMLLISIDHKFWWCIDLQHQSNIISKPPTFLPMCSFKSMDAYFPSAYIII